MRGVSLEEISAATRISTRFLEAMERDQWERLPGGVFNRGFIRSIARFLGLDEDSLVAEYSLGTVVAADVHVAAEHTHPAEIPRNWRPAAVAFVVVAVMIAGAFFAYARYGARVSARLHGRAGAAIAHAGAGTNTPNTSGIPKESSPARRAAAVPAAGELPSAGEALRLKIEAGKPASVKVIADGAAVFDGPVQANDKKEFAAREYFEITSSESSALLLELNGQALPPIGTPGQPGGVTLTRQNLKAAAGGNH